VGRSRKEPSGTYWLDGARLKKKSGFSIIVHAPTALAPHDGEPAAKKAKRDDASQVTTVPVPPAPEWPTVTTVPTFAW
jgi:hypothetical protein